MLKVKLQQYVKQSVTRRKIYHLQVIMLFRNFLKWMFIRCKIQKQTLSNSSQVLSKEINQVSTSGYKKTVWWKILKNKTIKRSCIINTLFTINRVQCWRFLWKFHFYNNKIPTTSGGAMGRSIRSLIHWGSIHSNKLCSSCGRHTLRTRDNLDEKAGCGVRTYGYLWSFRKGKHECMKWCGKKEVANTEEGEENKLSSLL